MRLVGLVVMLCCAVSYGQTSQVIEVLKEKDTVSGYFVNNQVVFEEGWHQLPQPNFWRTILSMPPDSCVINVAATRQIFTKMTVAEWNKQTDDEKELYRDSVRKHFELDSAARIYMTSGKSHFYNFKGVKPSISKGVELFSEYGVDPWFAQSILLIESPGKLAYSNVGAYGPFQLMKGVAIRHGLKVNKRVDERKNFTKSAQGACSLLRKTCIPEAKRILKKHHLSYKESDLWFKLFVLHIYHAGAGNVDGLLASIEKKEAGMSLIKTMWQSEWGGFKNASQNYSQVALATMIILQEDINQESKYIYECFNRE